MKLLQINLIGVYNLGFQLNKKKYKMEGKEHIMRDSLIHWLNLHSLYLSVQYGLTLFNNVAAFPKQSQSKSSRTHLG